MSWTTFDNAGAALSRSFSDTPVGTILGYGGSTAPSGWLLCDGSAVSRTSYAELWSVIGTSYGSGDGSTTFNVPETSGFIIYAQSISSRVATNSPPQYVTSLPSSPVDGQTVVYAADAANGVMWTLRYRAASSSSYKWEFVGGTPLYASTGTGANDVTSTSTTYDNITSSTGPTITVPLAGDYFMKFDIESFRNDGGAGTDAYIAFQHGATNNAADAERISNGSGQLVPGSAERLWTGMAANDVIQAKYKVSSNTGRYRGLRTMYVFPRRVG